MFTILNDRILTFDGKQIVVPESIAKLLLNGIQPSEILSVEPNQEITKFNELVSDEEQIKIFNEEEYNPILNFEWLIPEYYKNLNLVEYFKKFETDKNSHRIQEELKLIEDFDATLQFQTIIYVVDVLKKQNVVWGVGRGSSCASYLLFLMGLHNVDCLKYDIQSSEFFHL